MQLDFRPAVRIPRLFAYQTRGAFVINAFSAVLVRPTYLVLFPVLTRVPKLPGHQDGSVCCSDAVDERTRIPCRKQ